jgi:hypothetical protein
MVVEAVVVEEGEEEEKIVGDEAEVEAEEVVALAMVVVLAEVDAAVEAVEVVEVQTPLPKGIIHPMNMHNFLENKSMNYIGYEKNKIIIAALPLSLLIRPPTLPQQRQHKAN